MLLHVVRSGNFSITDSAALGPEIPELRVGAVLLRREVSSRRQLWSRDGPLCPLWELSPPPLPCWETRGPSQTPACAPALTVQELTSPAPVIS